MTDASAFGLEPGHLGRHRSRDEIYLHTRVSARLDRIGEQCPHCVTDVLDGHGARMPVPVATSDFVVPVEMFDVPREAPHQIVVYGPDAAAQLGEAFPDLPCRPHAAPDGIAFELSTTHLGRDQFGLIHLSDEIRRAIDSLPGDARASRWKVLDGEGMPIAPSRTRASGQVAEFEGLNGFEPRYVVFHDRRAAETFGKLFPAMRTERLAELERLWRKARMP